MQTLRPLLTQIVVGTDFSLCAGAALDYASQLGAARITLVHVCELATELGLPDDLVTAARDEEQLARCRDQLAATVAAYQARGVAIQGLLRTGKPWEKLNNAAAEVGANLIVIGRVGVDGGGDRDDGQPFGVVAKHLMRRSSRPVLMVPPRSNVEVAP